MNASLWTCIEMKGILQASSPSLEPVQAARHIMTDSSKKNILYLRRLTNKAMLDRMIEHGTGRQVECQIRLLAIHNRLCGAGNPTITGFILRLISSIVSKRALTCPYPEKRYYLVRWCAWIIASVCTKLS